MASEARVQSSLQLSKGSISYQSRPTAFTADVSGSKGPTPGAFTATTDGVDVDLSQLTTPGLCRIANLEASGGNAITFGRWDPATNRYYPFARVLPGESYVLRLAPDIEDEYVGTGTGTGAAATTLRVKGENAACVALVEAFEA